MDPAANTTATRRMVRRRPLAGDEGHVKQGELVPRRVAELEAAVARLRAEELEAAVARLRAEKAAAERAAAALRAQLELEQDAAEAGTCEVMLMIGRLQREKSAAMIEAREFRLVAESRAGRVRELQDQLGEVYALATSYLALLRAHGIDPDVGAGEEESESDHQEDRDVERVENGNYSRRGGDTEAKAVLIKNPVPSPPWPPAAEEFVDKYAVDVRCAAAVAEEGAADVAGDLCARVEALEANSAAVRREVKALRAERAKVVLQREVARRLFRDHAPEKQRFSVLAIFKWFFSPIVWGMERSASVARKLPNIISSSSTTYLLLGLLPLLQRSKGTLQIQSKSSRQPVHSHGLEYLMICYFFQ